MRPAAIALACLWLAYFAPAEAASIRWWADGKRLLHGIPDSGVLLFGAECTGLRTYAVTLGIPGRVRGLKPGDAKTLSLASEGQKAEVTGTVSVNEGEETAHINADLGTDHPLLAKVLGRARIRVTAGGKEAYLLPAAPRRVLARFTRGCAR